MLTVPHEGLLQRLVDLLAGIFAVGNTASVHLFQNNVVPGINDTLATYTEANFDGYASQSLVQLGIPFINGAGLAEVDFQLLLFQATGSVTPNTIYGYWVDYTPGGGFPTLLWSERFDNPIAVGAPGDTVPVEPQLLAASLF